MDKIQLYNAVQILKKSPSSREGSSFAYSQAIRQYDGLLSDAQTLYPERSDIKSLVSFNTTTVNIDEFGDAVNRLAFALELPATELPNEELFPLELLRGIRGYIGSIAEQACGSYAYGWYDAAAVMSRRLLETLIIECFEAHSLSSKIKNSNEGFFYLGDLITSLLSETSWSISRNTIKALKELKEIGDQSAHSRRFLARKADLDKVKRDLRITIEELLHLGKLVK